MDNISKIDQNFAVAVKVDSEGTAWFDPMQPPFSIHGLIYENGAFRRMPGAVAKAVSEGVYYLHANCSGGRLRFRTDSSYITIRAKMGKVSPFAHMPMTGSAGFDLYMDRRHVSVFVPPANMTDGYESRLAIPEPGMHTITVYFPLYADVYELEVGMAEGSRLEAAEAYPNEKPIVFYGSSITQGGVASRAGMCYTNRLCQRLNRDIWNLGFSGSAKGEPAMAEYVAKLPMECFVYDYDHNARTVADLERTHEPMFQTVRQAHPDIPIIMMSCPRFVLDAYAGPRLPVIRRTYENAKAAGDRNVYLITGQELMIDAQYDGVVDGIHPNDFGFCSMARVLGDLLEKLLK